MRDTWHETTSYYLLKQHALVSLVSSLGNVCSISVKVLNGNGSIGRLADDLIKHKTSWINLCRMSMYGGSDHTRLATLLWIGKSRPLLTGPPTYRHVQSDNNHEVNYNYTTITITRIRIFRTIYLTHFHYPCYNLCPANSRNICKTARLGCYLPSSVFSVLSLPTEHAAPGFRPPR